MQVLGNWVHESGNFTSYINPGQHPQFPIFQRHLAPFHFLGITRFGGAADAIKKSVIQ
jgi:hypothetical protein